MRSGECLAITLDDFIDTSDGKAIYVNKNYARLNGEDLLLDPKTPKSNRLITIPDFVYQEVLNYVNQLYDYQNDERLIPITKTLLNKEIIKGAAVADLKRIRVHDLRHSHASLLIELGYSPLLISERLGHDRVETTLQTYSHLYPNKHGEVAQKLQEFKPA